MKKIITLTFIFIMSLSAHSIIYAQVQIYKGYFADGTATYSYKQSDDFTRIFDGNFSYKSSDGKKGMSGKYSSDVKVGEWIINWYGFQEKVHYKEGLKHGLYKVRYKVGNNELTIDGNFIKGDIDSLNFTMATPQYRLRGTYHQGKSIWIYTSGAISYTQYFYDNTYACETQYDQSTGEWKDITVEDAKELMNLVDYIKSHDYTSPNGTYYKAVAEVDSPFFKDLQNNGGDIFEADFKWLNEPAHFFIYKFHEAAFDEILMRGEVCDFYHPLCHYLTGDTARKKAEEEKEAIEIRKRNEERARKLKAEREYQNKIEQTKKRFEQSEYGQMIISLGEAATKSDEEFEQAKRKYIQNTLVSHYRIAQSPIKQAYGEGIHNIKYRYSNVDEGDFIEQSFDIRIPKGIGNHSILVLPTEMIIRENRPVITRAIIVYGDTDVHPYFRWSHEHYIMFPFVWTGVKPS